MDDEYAPSVVGGSVEDDKRTSRETFSFPEMSAGSYALDDNDGIPRLSRALSNKSRSTKSNLAAVAKKSTLRLVDDDEYVPSVVGGSVEDDKRTSREVFSFPEMSAGSFALDDNDGIPRLSRVLSNKSRSTKLTVTAIAKSSLKAGTAGFGKAVEVLDTLGSSMTSLHLSSRGFVSRVATNGSKITMLSFEVANTIVKGASLMQSLSKDNIKHLKEVVLPSEGVQRLISKDMDELLRLAASDKREELKIFSGEVIRFGNLCIDPQWHNLDRYFEKMGSELIPQKQLKEAETIMDHLKNLVQYTAVLYHELHALDRFEQDFRRKQQEEENPNAPPRGGSLDILRTELKSQKKHVRSLQRKSLWSKNMEEVMEQLVDIVRFLHLEIHNVFGNADTQTPVKSDRQNLGAAGLALHYANIITQIDTLVTRSSSVPPSARDSLYQGLTPNIKSAMRSKLHSFHPKEELTIPEIKAEMEKTLQWLVPIATNTTKAYHGFGWVGEWANTGFLIPCKYEANRKASCLVDSWKIETLHHADKEKTEECILELIVWLHHLVCQSLTTEDREMLRDISKRKLTVL
ncbi:hypothetical protein L1987_64327 [Smallanthus sonchifolius]|uniref:Uncharacterized protein n=1 Tax=Smallanthus sonchifolius TaxID=185202 RepID=A0ACB9CFP2_9ASTR|nr:hypothetical protein L1987_64327 [Smallanthus sonchifolius]